MSGSAGTPVFGHLCGFSEEKCFPVPTSFQIEAIVSESVFETNCFYLKWTWLPEALGLLLFEKKLNIFYLCVPEYNGTLMGFHGIYPLVMTNSLLLKMAIEIVEFSIEHGDFP